MAIYHLSVKTVSRSAGRSATAAAAYRAGCEITDERTGQQHDYSRKQGVVHSEIILPEGADERFLDRSTLWNEAEQSEKRVNSTVAREYEVALPAELDKEQRKELAQDFGGWLSERYGVGVDVCIHEPNRDGDERNHHAHILTTTRKIEGAELTTKTRELDDRKSGAIDEVRDRWADLVNHHLGRAQIRERVSQYSHERRGLEELPTRHEGPLETHSRRRHGEIMERTADNDERRELNRQLKADKSQVYEIWFSPAEPVQEKSAELDQAQPEQHQVQPAELDQEHHPELHLGKPAEQPQQQPAGWSAEIDAMWKQHVEEVARQRTEQAQKAQQQPEQAPQVQQQPEPKPQPQRAPEDKNAMVLIMRQRAGKLEPKIDRQIDQLRRQRDLKIAEHRLTMPQKPKTLSLGNVFRKPYERALELWHDTLKQLSEWRRRREITLEKRLKTVTDYQDKGSGRAERAADAKIRQRVRKERLEQKRAQEAAQRRAGVLQERPGQAKGPELGKGQVLQERPGQLKPQQGQEQAPALAQATSVVPKAKPKAKTKWHGKGLGLGIER